MSENDTHVRPDAMTVAAIAIAAACIVTFDHEALGHGGACLAIGGHIATLTSSIFHCDVGSDWIDPAGPAMNLLIGTLALVARRFVKTPGLRLFLVLMTAFSYFWESGYLVQAMLTQDGDLYFAARAFIGGPQMWWRVIGVIAGAALFIAAWRLTASGLLALWSAPKARRVARLSWVAATASTFAAALLYRGGVGKDLHDAFMEIGVASCPLLVLPYGRALTAPAIRSDLPRSWTTLVAATVIFLAFAATLGQGLT